MINENMSKKAKRRINQTIKGLGNWDVLDGNIICIVNKNNKYRFKLNNFYSISLTGLFDYIPLEYSLSDLNLQDKKIVYHISNFDFDNYVRIEAYNNADIIFNNCTFNDDVDIINGENISFVKCKFNGNRNAISTRYDKKYINKLSFAGCDMDKDISLSLAAKRVEMINSKIDDILDLDVDSSEFLIGGSKISINNSELNSDKIIFKDSSINCDIMVINSEDVKSVGFQNLKVNNLFYNDIEFGESFHHNGVVTKGNPFNPTESDVSLQYNRLLLLDVLKKTLNKCDDIINEDVEKIRNEARDNSIARVLKK